MMIFKEAMSNSLKHAQARRVKLKIQKTEVPEIVIALCDDGVGFNPLFIKKGHGFQNMQKRANRIKSVFAMESSPGKGARYEIRIPLHLFESSLRLGSGYCNLSISGGLPVFDSKWPPQPPGTALFCINPPFIPKKTR